MTEVTVPNRMAADRSIEDHFIQDVLEYMRREIRSSKDREVFFVCNTDLNGMVQSANVEARGNAHAVPAIVDRCLPHDVVVHNHPGGNLSPSDADLSVASHLGNSSVGFYIINNEVDDLYVVVEPFPRSKASPRRIGDEMLGVFEVGGALPTLLPGFQSRPAQLDMARSVLDAFNESRVLTMEAGTGTGKSFAYLVPALSWAHKTGERVVISTNTISLQEQLLHKDIPLIKKALGIELDVELVKGRSNYVCKRKLDVVAREPNLFAGDDDRKILEDLLEWAGSSQDGTRSDLSFVPPFEVWDKIVSESDTTLGVRCEHYQDCFFNSARRRASKAKVLLVNHHLLCADLALRSGPSAGGVSFGLLPPHSRVVIDEAHNLEDVASSYFGSAVTLQGAIRLMSKIHREGRKGGGVLAMIKTKLRPGRGINDRLMDRIDAFHVPGLISLRGGIESFFSSVWQVLLRASRGSESDFGSSEGELKVRLTPAIHSMIHELGLDDELVDLAQQLNLLARDLIGLVEELRVLGNDGEERGTEAQEILLKAYAGRLAEFAGSLTRIFDPGAVGRVAWIEGRKLRDGRSLVRVAECPIEVADRLGEALFGPLQTVVCTSATLTVGGRFDYFAKRVGVGGLRPPRWQSHTYPSPFDYGAQVLFGIPTDLPDPASREFLPAVSRFLEPLLLVSGGGAFILCTSFRMLNRLQADLTPLLAANGIASLVQGHMPRTQLLDRFRDTQRSVLFGTNSFWEGVDVPGSSLRLVVIPKLPFLVPTEPLVEARQQAIEKRGGSAFNEYTLPQAVIRLRQGFGRLVRSESDEGVVLVLDTRLVKKAYGRIFIDSLPPARRCIEGTESILQQVRAFL